MHESLPSRSASLPPIAEPHGAPVVPANSSGSDLVLGNLLAYGFVGQIVFTIMQFSIVNSTTGRAEAGASMDKQMALLVIPLACAIAGGVTARKQGFPWLGHPVVIALLVFAGGILGLFNLIVWALTGGGYC